MIRFGCVGCGEELEVPDCLAGESETCPRCHATNRVPASIASAADPVSDVADDPLALLAQAAASSTTVAYARRAPIRVPEIKLMVRDPVLAWARSGVGPFLLLAFFLPFIDITCNGNSVSNPSGFNLVTGTLDAKTRGTLGMSKELDSMANNAGPPRRAIRPQPAPRSEFSWWSDDNLSNQQPASSRSAGISGLVARLSLCIYGWVLLPVMGLVCGALLRGQFSKAHARDPAWDAKLHRLLRILYPASLFFLVVFAVAIRPDEIPPPIEFNYDWGLYLTIISLIGGTAVMIVRKYNPADSE